VDADYALPFRIPSATPDDDDYDDFSCAHGHRLLISLFILYIFSTRMLLKVCVKLAMFITCAESQEYHRVDAVMGDTIVMSCNATPSSGAVWTQNTTSGEFSYVYINGSITGHPNILSQFSVVNASAGDYSLKIYNVHPTYSGFYDCRESNGSKRIIGYYLVAKGMSNSNFVTV